MTGTTEPLEPKPDESNPRSQRRGARPGYTLEALECRRMLSLSGYWKLDTVSSGTSPDVSGNSNSLSLVNGPSLAMDGVHRSAVSFDGVNDHGQLPASVGSSASLSVSFWARANTLRHQIPLDKMPGAGSNGWNIKFRSNGDIWFRVGSNASARDARASGGYVAGQWVHVAATYEPGTSGGVARLYIGGQLRVTTTGITQTPADGTVPLRLAQPSTIVTTEIFGGQLDDIRIYSRAISADEVSALTLSNASLSAAVMQLPTATADQALKRAALIWAVEDVNASLAAGLQTIALDTYDDLRTMLHQPVSGPQTPPSGLLPSIPSFSSNPLATSAMSSLTTLRNSTTTYAKDPTPIDFRIPLQGRDMAWGLTHAQSPLRRDPTLMIAMLRRFQRVFETNLAGVDNDNFMVTATAHEMYRILDAVHPELILPSRRVQWEAAILRNVNQTLARHGTRLNGTMPGTSWVNADVRHMAALALAAEILNEPSYRTVADNVLQLVSGSILPDGGFMYDRMQNEVYTYHGENIIWLARYWQLYGAPLARQLIVDSYWYYPLSVEPNGTAEYSTGSAWKRYWNQTSGAEAATIVADLANSPENLRVARWTNPTPSLFLSTFFRGDLVPTASPDQYITYDRNIMGPRGRFGSFSFSGTASPYTGEDRGKATHVGAMVTDFTGTNNGWRLNAAFDVAQSRVRYALGPDDNTIGNDINPATARIVYYDQALQERNAYISSERFATLSTSHRLGRYKGSAQPWLGEQQWIMTPERILGRVSLESLANQSAFSMLGSLRFVGGRNTWGTLRQFVQVDENTFSYGKFTVDIWDQNYGTITTTYEDTWDDTSVVRDNRSGRLNFIDTAAAEANESTLISYPAGTKRYYVVEIRPNTTTTSADAVTHGTTTEGLLTLETRSGSNRLLMLTNPTASPITYTTNLPWTGVTGTPQGAILRTAGEQHRADFLSAFDRPDADARIRTLSPTQPRAVATTSVTVTIPAYQHVTLEPWLPGDINQDRRVDFSDLLILSRNYSSTDRSLAQGDIDGSGDGAVGFADLLVLARNYGQTFAAISAPVSASMPGTSPSSNSGIRANGSSAESTEDEQPQSPRVRSIVL